MAKNLDYTSFAIVEMTFDQGIGDFVYHLVALDRIKDVDYPTVVKMIIDVIAKLEALGSCVSICMDASGLGAPIKDYLEKDGVFNHLGRELYPVVFTGGESARYDRETHNYNISKALIIGNFLSLMQHKRFDYAKDLQALPLLEQEISSFKRHLTPSGKTTFDAEGDAHDDMICAICIPLIIGEVYLRGLNTPIALVHEPCRSPFEEISGSLFFSNDDEPF